jgi:hypothetical protein
VAARYGSSSRGIDTTLRKFTTVYTIMRDTLFSITNNGANFNPYVRADSSNTFGPHWQILPKPEGWDLN